MACASFRARH